MNIRTASFRDLAPIEQLHREATAEENDETAGALSENSPVPRRTLLRLWRVVNRSMFSLVPLYESGDTLFVAEDPQQGVVGFIQAQATGQRRAWQIVNLCTSPTPRGHFAREQLIEHLCNEGMEHGVSRFHVRVPVDHPLVQLFIEQGFTQYATEQILYRDDTTELHVPESSDLLRPAHRDDVAGIHLLYLRTTPSAVTQVEAPSLATWRSGFIHGWMARIGRDDVRHWVAERPGIVAWVGFRPASGARPAVLAMLCEGHDAGFREELVDAALALLPSGPVSCVLRHYDSELIRSLQKRQFEIFGAQLLLVRDLAQKVRLRSPAPNKKPVLVHAGLANSVEAGPTLRVLSAPHRRRT